MTQHLLLIALAAPLLALSLADAPWLRLPPVWAWLGFVTVFLFWHWPAAFRWAAIHPAGEALELASILLAATGFWRMVLGTGPLNDGARALSVVAAAFVTDLPGVVMIFSPVSFCAMPAEDASAFGLTPLGDQQLGGLLMWVPANLVFFGIAVFLFAHWISRPPKLVTP